MLERFYNFNEILGGASKHADCHGTRKMKRHPRKSHKTRKELRGGGGSPLYLKLVKTGKDNM